MARTKYRRDKADQEIIEAAIFLGLEEDIIPHLSDSEKI